MTDQHDYVIDNAVGSAFRADINLMALAIASNNDGASAPSTTYAYQWWADTGTGLLKIRNAANSAWVTVGTLASTNLNLAELATANSFSASQTFLSTDAGAALGPTLFIYRASASPAANDLLAQIEWLGLNLTPAQVGYAQIYCELVDPAIGSEDGRLHFDTCIAGTPASRLSIGAGMLYPSATGGDKGVGTINMGDYYRNGNRPIAHCSGYITYSGGTPTLVTSDNVTSISDTGTGRVQVTIATDHASANYACLTSCESTGSAGSGIDVTAPYVTLAAGGFEIQGRNAGVSTDPPSLGFATFGA